MHRAVLLAQGSEIMPEAIRLPDGTQVGGGVWADRRSARPRAKRRWKRRKPRRAVWSGRTVAEVERDLILDTLDHCLGNRTHAANILGISIRTLRNKLREYGDAGLQVAQPGETRLAG